MKHLIENFMSKNIDLEFLKRFNENYHDEFMKIIRNQSFLDLIYGVDEDVLLFILNHLNKDILKLDYASFLINIRNKRKCLTYLLDEVEINQTIAVRDVKVENKLSSNGFYLNEKHYICKVTLFTKALFDRNAELIHFLMDKGFRLNSFDYRILRDNDELYAIVSEMENFDDVMAIKDMNYY